MTNDDQANPYRNVTTLVRQGPVVAFLRAIALNVRVADRKGSRGPFFSNVLRGGMHLAISDREFSETLNPAEKVQFQALCHALIGVLEDDAHLDDTS